MWPENVREVLGGLGEQDSTSRTMQECVTVKLCVWELIPPFNPFYLYFCQGQAGTFLRKG